MKKFLALLLSVAMMVIPMTALAAEVTPSIDYTVNEVTVADSFDASLAGRIATLVVVNPGKDIADFATDGVIAWADQCILDNEGSFKFVINMANTASGDGYKVYVTVAGADEAFEGTFDYSKDEIDKSFLEIINDAEVKAAVDKFIRETAKDRITELDEDLVEDYINLKNETKVAEKMLDYIPFDTMEEFVEILRDEVDAQEKAEDKGKGSGGSSSGGGGFTVTVQPEVMNPQTPVTPVDPEPTVENPFTDVADGFWGKDAILSLYQKGIVAGQAEGIFNPGATITRAEFVQMVVKAFALTLKGDDPAFDDVADADWYAEAVKIAYSNGVVNGTSASTFAPNNNITRQDMMTILSNAAKATGAALTSGDVAFTDAGEIAEYAKAAVAEMVGSGVVSGYTDGSVKPLNNASRAEAAAMLARLLEVK